MTSRTILLLLQPASAMGRGIMAGVAAHAAGRSDWVFGTIPYEHIIPGTAIGPDVADGVIATVRPEIARAWSGPARRFVVNVSRRADIPGCANVTCDDTAIGRLAAEHLLDKQLEHFAWFGNVAPDNERLAAYRGALAEAGYEATVIDVATPAAEKDARLAELARPCGILAFNDITAAELVRRAVTLGLGVPGDLAVVGVDNDTLETIFSPAAVTSVDPDFHTIGRRAAEILDDVLRGGEPPDEPIRIPPAGIVERDSTDFPGRMDPLATQAARLIRHRARDGMSVEDVADALHTSYQTLRRRFQATFGHRLIDELTRVRIEAAAELLAETRMPMIEIAERVGYRNAKHFGTVFRKHMGTPPGRYRKRKRAEADADEG